MIVRCISTARAKLAPSSTSATASPSVRASSAKASRVTGSACSQAGERTKAKGGGQRRLRRGHRGKRRTGGGPRVGVLLVEADERLRDERHVLDRAREHADVIE